MDCRHNFPVLCLGMSLDWSNPLLYWFVGFVGSVAAAVLLAAAHTL